MKVIERVVKSAGEPGKTDLWLKEKGTGLQLCAYHNGQWVPISGGSGGSSVSWGTESDYTVPLTVEGVSKTICLDGYSGDCPCQEVYFDAEFINVDGALSNPSPSGAEGIQMAKTVLSAISEGTDWYNIGPHLSGELNGAEIEYCVKFSDLWTIKSGDDIVAKQYYCPATDENRFMLPISYNSEQLDILLDINEQLDGDGLVIFVDPNLGISLGKDQSGYLICGLCREENPETSAGCVYVVDESGYCYEVSDEYVMGYPGYNIYRITDISNTQHPAPVDAPTSTLPYSDVTKFVGSYIAIAGLI